jgi:hypothetical protein
MLADACENASLAPLDCHFSFLRAVAPAAVAAPRSEDREKALKT